ncbi:MULTISPECIES: hypothetical protein [Paenibacillus]|uniref:hypothetical protein n=1 Tax=Paenibacillus TaxID=44249 RepID=UPI00158B0982|nr:MULTISPECIES: hypothetical protein [Paenibacillus]MDH6429280.1 hypothetical protein [Paenibacillus sp. PastH-4]MDH6445487.1 hypothetical protein [Paenibacillus sp. PastF-4]MDH6529375.1 hypothetical protein [Paenibacillus sp. PastH-3]
MNKSETEKAVKSANGLKAVYPLDEIEQLFEQYEEVPMLCRKRSTAWKVWRN